MLLDRFSRWLVPLAVANLVVNIGIVVTGGAVRLTGSGLGCPTWPRCTDTSYVPHDALGVHGAIEFGNRMLTWLLVAVAVLCVLAAWRAAGRTRVLALVVALGVPMQAVLGGVTVRTDLNPWIVSLHLLVSMAIIGVCVALLDEVRGAPRLAATSTVRRMSWLVLATTWVVLYLGTVVTGSGPHSGDLDSRRTGLDPQLMSHVHAWAVYAVLAFTVVLLVLAHRSGNQVVRRAVGVLFILELAQGLLGFVQYFTDLPELLVGLHMLGAALISGAATWAWLATVSRNPSHLEQPTQLTTSGA